MPPQPLKIEIPETLLPGVWTPPEGAPQPLPPQEILLQEGMPQEPILPLPLLGQDPELSQELGFESALPQEQQSLTLEATIRKLLAPSEDVLRTGQAIAGEGQRASKAIEDVVAMQVAEGVAGGEALQRGADIQKEIARETHARLKTLLANDVTMRQEALNFQEKSFEVAREKFAALLNTQRELARKTVDPNHYWNSRTTGQKVGIAIGMILHDIGAAMTGSNRRAIDIVQNAINNDINAQREDIAAAQRGLEIETAAFGVEREFNIEELAKMEAERTGAWERFESMLMLHKASTADKTIQANLDAAIAVARQQAGESTIRGISHQAEVEMGGFTGLLRAQEASETMRLRAEAMVRGPEPPPLGTQYLPGAPQLSAGDATKVKGYLGDQQSAKATLQELMRLRANMPTTAWTGWGPDARRVKQKFGEMIDHIRHLKGWGARFEATEAEVLIKAYLGSKDDPTDWGFMMSSMEEFDRSLDVGLYKTLEGYGLSPVGLQTTPTEEEEEEIGFVQGGGR